MDYNALFAAQKLLMGDDKFLYGNQLHADTKVEAIQQMIDTLQDYLKEIVGKEDEGKFGYRIHLELFEKTKER